MARVHHWQKGKGTPLILVHGFCETSEIWIHFVEALASKFTVIVPDLPGFGSSPLPGKHFSLEEIGTIMLEWMKPWQADHPAIIGHSLGGYVTLAMAGLQPGNLGRFGLFHSTCYADTEEKKVNRNKVINFVKRHGVEPFIDSFVPGLFYQQDPRTMAEVRRIALGTSADTLVAYAEAMRDRPSTENVVSTFPKPILFLAGEQDTIVPVEQVHAQSLHALSPVFHSLRDVGHMGMFENEPEALKIVAAFMDFGRHFRPN